MSCGIPGWPSTITKPMGKMVIEANHAECILVAGKDFPLNSLARQGLKIEYVTHGTVKTLEDLTNPKVMATLSVTLVRPSQEDAQNYKNGVVPIVASLQEVLEKRNISRDELTWSDFKEKSKESVGVIAACEEANKYSSFLVYKNMM